MKKLLSLMIDNASKEDCDLLDKKIDDFNVHNVPCKTLEAQIHYAIKVEDRLVAGITSYLYFDQILYIAILFVDEDYRNQDLGSFLLAKVESEARARGAKLIHLDTFDFQAHQFYPKYGFEAFGVLEMPNGLKRYYFKKNL